MREDNILPYRGFAGAKRVIKGIDTRKKDLAQNWLSLFYHISGLNAGIS